MGLATPAAKSSERATAIQNCRMKMPPGVPGLVVAKFTPIGLDRFCLGSLSSKAIASSSFFFFCDIVKKKIEIQDGWATTVT
jgi:hypothetical protein